MRTLKSDQISLMRRLNVVFLGCACQKVSFVTENGFVLVFICSEWFRADLEMTQIKQGRCDSGRRIGRSVEYRNGHPGIPFEPRYGCIFFPFCDNQQFTFARFVGFKIPHGTVIKMCH